MAKKLPNSEDGKLLAEYIAEKLEVLKADIIAELKTATEPATGSDENEDKEDEIPVEESKKVAAKKSDKK